MEFTARHDPQAHGEKHSPSQDLRLDIYFGTSTYVPLQGATTCYVLGEGQPPAFPFPESQTHLCHGGRGALQDGLGQELLCEVTGRWGWQGSLGKRGRLLTNTTSGLFQRSMGALNQLGYLG